MHAISFTVILLVVRAVVASVDVLPREEYFEGKISVLLGEDVTPLSPLQFSADGAADTAPLVRTSPAPLRGRVSSSLTNTFDKRACSPGWGTCRDDPTQSCCPLGGDCCNNGRCCNTGYWCYGSAPCCRRGDRGCDNQGCVPPGGTCCAGTGGRYCPFGSYCGRDRNGKSGCCPNGKTCNGTVQGCGVSGYILCQSADYCCPAGAICIGNNKCRWPTSSVYVPPPAPSSSSRSSSVYNPPPPTTSVYIPPPPASSVYDPPSSSLHDTPPPTSDYWPSSSSVHPTTPVPSSSSSSGSSSSRSATSSAAVVTVTAPGTTSGAAPGPRGAIYLPAAIFMILALLV